jgi:hypothetical protein
VCARFDSDWDNLVAAHTWALATGNLDVAVSTLHQTFGFGSTRMRRDHQEIVERTRAACDAAGHQYAELESQRGFWALMDGDADRAIEIASDAIGNADQSGAQHVLPVLALGLLSAGRTDDAIALVPRLQAIIDSDSDHRYKGFADWVIPQVHLGTVECGPALDRFVAYAERTNAPSDLSTMHRLQAQAILSGTSTDFDQAITHSRKAIDAIESIGGNPMTGEGTLIAAMIMSRHADTAMTCRRFLADAYDKRFGIAIDFLLETIPLVVPEASPDAAATIIGYTERYPVGWGGFGAIFREMSISAIDGASNATQEAGASMDRHQIVAFALAALDDVIGTRGDG